MTFHRRTFVQGEQSNSAEQRWVLRRAERPRHWRVTVPELPIHRRENLPKARIGLTGSETIGYRSARLERCRTRTCANRNHGRRTRCGRN